MSSAARVVLAIAVLLLIVAVRTLFVGYDSYTPLLFAQYYIGAFAIVTMFPTMVRTGRSAAGDHMLLLFVAAATGAVLFQLAAPRIGGPNYCGGEYLLYSIVRVPTVYRCTSWPFEVAGWFAGWWITVWAVGWWTAILDPESRDAASTAEKQSPPVYLVVVLAVALLIVAVAKLYLGSDKFEPLVLAEIYIWLFTLFMAVPTLIRAERTTPQPDWFVLYAAALVGAVVLWNVAPQIGEPNYCMPLPRGLRLLQDMAKDISRMVGVPQPVRVLPKVFRCTTIPLAVAGGFSGWWIALWLGPRRKSTENSEPY